MVNFDLVQAVGQKGPLFKGLISVSLIHAEE